MNRRDVLKRIGAAGVIAAFGVYGFKIEPNNIEQNYFSLKTTKLTRKVRIVHLSDTHFDNDLSRYRISGMVNRLNPDVIVMTGDYTNPPHDIYLKRFKQFINAMQAKQGIYACFGNWDDGFEDLMFRDTAVKTLRDSSVRLEFGSDKVQIFGMNYLMQYVSRVVLNDMFRSADSKDYNVFLYHSPDLIDMVAETSRIDLYLSGHTHGGLIRVPFLKAFEEPECRGTFPYTGALLMPYSKYGRKYDAGLYTVKGTTLYVSKGIGIHGKLPFRINCNPEITIFDIGPG